MSSTVGSATVLQCVVRTVPQSQCTGSARQGPVEDVWSAPGAQWALTFVVFDQLEEIAIRGLVAEAIEAVRIDQHFEVLVDESRASRIRSTNRKRTVCIIYKNQRTCMLG